MRGLRISIPILLFILVQAVIPSSANAQSFVSLSSRVPLQGDVVLVQFSDEVDVTSVSFNSKTATTFKLNGKNSVVLAFGVTHTPGAYNLSYNLNDGKSMKEVIVVRRKNFPKLTLGIPKELGITSNQLVQNLAVQKQSIQKRISAGNTEPLFTKPFGLPLYDNRKITSVFGEIRKTGENEIRHLGVDFGGRLGAPVAAINAGKISGAYFDPVYGNSVIIDHGAGIFSLYLHLNEMRVKEGDVIGRGGVIGTLGKTGYSTSPHLHLSLKIGEVSVDPIRFVSSFSKFQ